MKKVLASILAFGVTLSLLAGCGGGTSSAPVASLQETSSQVQQAEPVNITIWHSADATIADTLQKQVDTLAPEIVVTFERKENMSESLKLVGNDPASAPDMYFWAHDKVGVFAEMGILAPITDVVSEADLSELLPMTLDAGTYQGNRYQLPVYFETLLFMYNKALMKTPPETVAELLEKMKAETTPDTYVFVEQHSTSYYAAAWLQGYNSFIINENKEPGLNKQGTIDALTYHLQMLPYMPADGEYNTVTTLFTEGKAMATIGGPWIIPGVKEAGIDLGIAPMPLLENGEPLKPFSGVQGVQVLKHAAQSKKEAVAKVLKVLASAPTGVAVAKAASCAPANEKAYSDATVSADEMIMALKDMAPNVVPMPNIPEMDVMWGVTDSLLASVNKNGGDVVSECEKYQQEALAQIEAMQ